MKFRQAKQADIKQLSGVIQSVILDYGCFPMTVRKQIILEYNTRELLEMVKSKKDFLYVITEGKKIVGFVFGDISGGVAWIEWVGILKEQRGKGLGLELMILCEKDLKKKGVKKIWFDSVVENKVIEKLSKKIGYKKLCTIKKHWFGLDFFLWIKSI